MTVGPDDLPDHRPPDRHPAQRFLAAVGWLCRAADAVGSPRFAETHVRASICVDMAADVADTPARKVVVRALADAVMSLASVDSAVRSLLQDSVSGMDALIANTFVWFVENSGEGDAGKPA